MIIPVLRYREETFGNSIRTMSVNQCKILTKVIYLTQSDQQEK